MAIRPGFENVSWQHALHAQQRSYLTNVESFVSAPKSSKRKKGSTGKVQRGMIVVETQPHSANSELMRQDGRGKKMTNLV